MYKVLGTNTYENEIAKWSKDYRAMAEKLPKKLAINPFVGAPLGYRFLREKRIKEKRIYFLVYEDIRLVLLIAVSGKKDQQATIDHIKGNLDEFRKESERLSKQIS